MESVEFTGLRGHGQSVFVESDGGRRIGRRRRARQNGRLSGEHLHHVDTGAVVHVPRLGRYPRPHRSRRVQHVQSAPEQSRAPKRPVEKLALKHGSYNSYCESVELSERGTSR